jgi:hypothetical protein
MFNGDFQHEQPICGTDASSFPNHGVNNLDADRYEFPYKLAPIIGLRKEQIYFLKKLGCPFMGKKTTLRILREFASQRAIFESSERIHKSRFYR